MLIIRGISNEKTNCFNFFNLSNQEYIRRYRDLVINGRF